MQIQPAGVLMQGFLTYFRINLRIDHIYRTIPGAHQSARLKRIKPTQQMWLISGGFVAIRNQFVRSVVPLVV